MKIFVDPKANIIYDWLPYSPFDVILAEFPSVAVRTVAGVVRDVVVAGSSVVAGGTVAHVDAELTVGAGVAVERRGRLEGKVKHWIEGSIVSKLRTQN